MIRLSFLFLLTFCCSLPLPAPGQAGNPGNPTFAHGPDSKRQAGAPRGKVTRHEWKSRILPGTLRQWYLYVPAQYDGSKAAAVMILPSINELPRARIEARHVHSTAAAGSAKYQMDM